MVIMSGFIFMAVIHLSTQCELFSLDPIDNEEDITNLDIDNKGIEKISSKTEDAFFSGDPQQIAEIMLEESLEFYGDGLFNQDPVKLVEQGNAFKTRELTAASEIYAEYSYTYNDIKYTMSFARLDVGDWKLIRF